MIRSNSKILVSVIIPAYNVENYIEKCISSLLAQTLESLELICVDDGSTDSTSQLLDEFANRNTKIKVIHRNNGGLSAARNSGMAIATGKYIGFVDGDDWVDENMFKGLSDALEKNKNSELAVCGVETIFEYNEENNIKKGYDSYFRLNQFGEFCVDKNIFTINKPCWNKLYRRDFLCANRIIFPEGMNNEDEVFHYFVFSRSTHVTFVRGNWYKYMRYGTGIISDQNRTFIETLQLPDYFTKVWPLLIEYIKRDARYDLLPDMVNTLLYKALEFKSERTDRVISTLLHRLNYSIVADCIDFNYEGETRRLLQSLYDLNSKEDIASPDLSLLPLPLDQIKDTEHPRFSIIVPIYNSAKYLHRCLFSLRNQTFNNIEIICVNDGSTDMSELILNDYARLDKRIRILIQENKGTFVARKVGALAAKGEYIIFVDPDDWIEINTCERLNVELNSYNADIVQYAVILEYFENYYSKDYINGVKTYFHKDINVIDGNNEKLLSECFINEHILWNNWGKAIRMDIAKAAFLQMPDIRCNFAEDQVAMFYILSFSKNLINIQDELYHYRLGSGISTKNKESFEDFKIKLNCFELFDILCDFSSKYYLQESKVVKEVLDFINNSMMDNMWRRIIENAKQEDLKSWMSYLCEKAGIDRVIPYLMKEMNINNSRLQRKYYKHLRTIRLLIALAVGLLLTNILSLMIIMAS